MDFLGLIVAHQYVFLFIGMLLLGETVLLPAIYFSLDGSISPIAVVIISGLGTIVSDFVWYFIADYVPITRVKEWHRVKKHEEKFNRLSVLFDQHRYRILFLSKFVYGTRILVQIICGMKRMNFFMYLLVNTLGVGSYMAFLYAIAIIVDRSAAVYIVGEIKVAIAGFIVLVVGINLCIRYIIQKRWFQS